MKLRHFARWIYIWVVVFRNFQAAGLKFIIAHLSETFKENYWQLCSMRRKKWLNLMSQYWPCIRDKYHVVIKFFYNFEAKLCKCYHTTIYKLHLTFFKKLTQCCWNALLMLRKCWEFDVKVSTLYPWYTISTTYCEVNIPFNVEVVLSTLWKCCKFDFVISTLHQRC